MRRTAARRVSGPFIVMLWVACVAASVLAQTPGPVAPVLHDLKTIGDLASAFEHDRNTVRVLLLLSPT